MNAYEMEWLARARLEEARADAARRALIRRSLADRPGLRLWMGAALVRLGAWIQGGTTEPDVEAKRAPA